MNAKSNPVFKSQRLQGIASVPFGEICYFELLKLSDRGRPLPVKQAYRRFSQFGFNKFQTRTILYLLNGKRIALRRGYIYFTFREVSLC